MLVLSLEFAALASDVVFSAFAENIPLSLEFAALDLPSDVVISSTFEESLSFPVASFVLRYPELGFLSNTQGRICFTTTKIYKAKSYKKRKKNIGDKHQNPQRTIDRKFHLENFTVGVN
jgi:hypothetical protein